MRLSPPTNLLSHLPVTRCTSTRRKRRTTLKIILISCVCFSIFFNSMVGIEWMYVKRRILCSHIMHRGGQRQLSSDCATVWEPTGTGDMMPLEQMFPVQVHDASTASLTSTTVQNVAPPTNGIAYVIHYTECPEHIADNTLLERLRSLRGLADAAEGGGETAGGVAEVEEVTGSMSTFIDQAAIMHHSISCTVPGSEEARILELAVLTGGDNNGEGGGGGNNNNGNGHGNGNGNGNGGNGNGGNGNGDGDGITLLALSDGDGVDGVTTVTSSTTLATTGITDVVSTGTTATTDTVTTATTSVPEDVLTSQTVYAIIHPDAVTCVGPSGEEYDRATLLQSLGYWVNIWDMPVDETMLGDQPYIRDNIGTEGGLLDLMPLHALKLEEHEFAVVLDQNYVLTSSLEPVFAALRSSTDTFAYVPNPSPEGGVSSDLLVLKPSVALHDDILDRYVNTEYTESGGWGDKGIGLYPGGMGTSGILDYYINGSIDGIVPEDDPDMVLDPPNPTGMELERCKYANNADGECNLYPFEDLVGYMMTDEVCGQPWMCSWGALEDSWSPETEVMCRSFLVHWVQGREQFQTYFFNQPTNDGTGDYHVEVYHGLCTSDGPEGYIPMISETVPAQENCVAGSLEFHGCDPDYSPPTTAEIGSGLYLDVTVSAPPQCGVYVAEPNNGGAVVPFTGSARISGTGVPDTSMVFVIDRSGSACDMVGLNCAADENQDEQSDDALDCETAAILDLVAKVRDDATVNHVGLVSFSNQLRDIVSATIELPLTDINLFDEGQAHAIENSIRSVRCGGGTNYAAAVEKACQVIDASTTSNNVVIFISDGEPTAGGAPANFCHNNAVFHTIALGVDASCSGGQDTSLMDIALATSGTCQEVSNIPDIRPVLLEIGDIQFLSIQGSTVASEGIVNFGCEDIPNYSNSIGIQCKDIGPFCGEYLASESFSNLGHTGDSACCVCGGGVYMNVGDLEAYEPAEAVFPGYKKVVEYDDTAVMHEGVHKVCTTVMAAEAGVPGANVQCRDILVCPP